MQVGSLACQRDSYLQRMEATVVSSTRMKDAVEIILSDTVCFPTGGGQWNDLGTLGGRAAIKDVFRRGMDAVHVVSAEDGSLLKPGDTVTVEVDWERRFDVMQQHSGQHLLSAVAEQEFALVTVAWALGSDRSCIEVDLSERKAPSDDDLNALERRVNEMIRKAIQFSVQVTDRGTNGGLPEKMKEELAGGVIRNVRIGDFDNNPCCGTHVSNTAELQCCKLLHTEKIRGKNLRIYFLFGNRVLFTMHASLNRERVLATQLCSGPEQFMEKINLLQANVKCLTKSVKNQLKELADITAQKMASLTVDSSDGSDGRVNVIAHHREDAEGEFLTTLSKAACERSPETIFILTTGSVEAGGAALVIGPDGQEIQKVWKKFLEAMGSHMKGGGRAGRFQAKSSNWKNKSVALAAVGAVNVEL
ncbi:Threonyl/alanyl tRNA synthetase [Chytriomyces sp. MP71]|nr:Threonyl/alanyl tRNA synthetase [Chytriomyces sp. MP71]